MHDAVPRRGGAGQAGLGEILPDSSATALTKLKVWLSKERDHPFQHQLVLLKMYAVIGVFDSE